MTLWICPKCKEMKPTRHESVVRHIGRKHGSLGVPLNVNTLQTRDQMLASGSLIQIRRSFIRTPVTSTQHFSDISTTPDHGRTDIRPPDLFDRVTAYSQLKLVSEINQKVENVLNQNATIIASLKDLWIMISTLKR